jgi:hypothetical protein
MTEVEWLACEDPTPMLEFIRDKATDRKVLLSGCAFQRRIWHLPETGASRRWVDALEPFADGLLDRLPFPLGATPPIVLAKMLGKDAAFSSARLGLVDGPSEAREQTLLVRDIFGNPFRPVAFSLAWRTDTAVSLARTMYDSRDFGAMPILADALQDAGCDDEQVLTHCRDAKQTHVRGCWVVDGVLGLQ